MPIIHDTDILVLGAGLAGLRAALSAHRTDPRCRITIVSRLHGPSGSSFANRNNCLGMQVCFTSADRADLRQDILRLARPGIVHDDLIDIMTRESDARFEDLVRLGLRFRQNDDGSWVRLSACFSPHSRRAVVFDDLAHAYTCFRSRLSVPNVSWLTGMSVRHLLNEQPGDPVHGALLVHSSTGETVAIRSRATIVALGGPAPLFRHNLSGPGNTGTAYALMHAAGARLINTSFLQIMWSETTSKTFFPLQRLASAETLIGSEQSPLPPALAALLPERGTHCPCGYGLPDSAVDTFLASKLLTDETMVVCAGKKTFRISPMVHAGNGGAEIDGNGSTHIPGMFACGECASGMHGANRIGGGMVLATQIFGHRAGIRAAHDRERPVLGKKSFTQLVKKTYALGKSAPDNEQGQNPPPPVAWLLNNGFPPVPAMSTRAARKNSREQLAHTIQLIYNHYNSLTK